MLLIVLLPYRTAHLMELGRGAMGVVLLAEQQSPKRQVALKVLRPDAMTPIRERRFELETESLAMLKHPGIAPVYAAGRVELGDGGSVRAVEPEHKVGAGQLVGQNDEHDRGRDNLAECAGGGNSACRQRL